MVFCVNTYQRCEVKTKQGNKSPNHSDTGRKAATGTTHAALTGKVEYLIQTFYAVTFTAQSHETPLLISPAPGDSFNKRESCHALRAWRSSGLKITPTEA